MTGEKLLILDFGGQYTQLIARRVRELNVYGEIVPYNISIEEIRRLKPQGLILSGSASSVYSEGALFCEEGIFNLGIPVLGICYGMQLMADLLGGGVKPAECPEYGRTTVKLLGDDTLFYGIEPAGERDSVWMSHGDYVVNPPEGFVISALSENSIISAMFNRERNLFAVQFHPEVEHTPWGAEVIANFLFRICRFRESWTMESFVGQAEDKIREQVGSSGKAVCGLSGGVDSSVAAALVHRVIGERLTCIFVDHGLLRKGEAEQVTDAFRNKFGLNLVVVDAAAEFLAKLHGVESPEEKRKIIGNHFIRVFEREAKRIGNVRYLVQGTIYPDVIESLSPTGEIIKTHHNVGGLPERMELELVEPLRELFKDEVRRVGDKLGLPEELTGRHPFPGPGLAVRVLGAVTQEKLSIVREADAIVIEEVKRAGLYGDIWQVFAVLPDIKSVGVRGDKRSYAHTIALRAVTSRDAMTADWFRFPYDVLERVSSRVVNEIPQVNRFVYDITSKPPSTIEWE